MSEQPIPLVRRVALVKAAIARIEHAQARVRELAMDASSSGDDRYSAASDVHFAEREFSGQWQNVKAILEELCPK